MIVYAVYGVVEAEHQSYLAVVTEAKGVASVVDFNCFLATKWEFIPLTSENSEKYTPRDEVIISIIIRRTWICFETFLAEKHPTSQLTMILQDPS